MLRTILLTGLILAIAIGGGAASVQYALDRFGGFGALEVGQWNAYPAAGTPDSDPYAKAHGARNGALALGAAEGLIFQANRDRQGRALDRRCTYHISGATPPARFWTLYAADRSLHPLPPEPGMLPALHSRQILRDEDGSFTITVSPKAQPGNWLPVPGSGPFVLIMTFYDTPVASSSGLSDLVMPRASLVAEEAGCHG
ncbi:DUF1214 domain-containing protein [Phyllobacterium phragmitis]|uniref:DUF1214 domain-containing protein n=1 Tax=Phyllobacterium phragmitis TaxID=2670329 RepID=A0A2S9IZ36_9HYPH|nr:DUF1214 domain-containing protein [Phyllobacterium phragmitis]PRD45792.1 DUF1214 domain-containing protein [Phyllobacterium phragmitis]